MTVSLASLLVQETKDTIYSFAINVATALGLPVTSWQAGDPTRSLYHVEAEKLATLESVVAGYIASGFLDYATGSWLQILAQQVYGVTVPAATAATCDVVLTNNGGGVTDISPGDYTFKNSSSGATYHNTTGGHLSSGPGTALTVTVSADVAGSVGSAGAGQIDTLVTGLLGVTVSNALPAVGIDQQDDATTRQQCRNKLGALSPNGPAAAYSYVALNSALTGTSQITRCRVFPTSTTGNVSVYLAGPSGAVLSGDLTLAQAAILKWATPLCITPSVLSAANVSVPITYSLWLYASVNQTAAQVQAAVQLALQKMFAARAIGGDIIPPATTGAIYQSMIESTIRGVYPQAFRCVVSAPAGDTAVANNQVAALGVITPTITIVPDPL